MFIYSLALLRFIRRYTFLIIALQIYLFVIHCAFLVDKNNTPIMEFKTVSCYALLTGCFIVIVWRELDLTNPTHHPATVGFKSTYFWFVVLQLGQSYCRKFLLSDVVWYYPRCQMSYIQMLHTEIHHVKLIALFRGRWCVVLWYVHTMSLIIFNKFSQGKRRVSLQTGRLVVAFGCTLKHY